jgi:polar amino acid transport system substrate-binding protein
MRPRKGPSFGLRDRRGRAATFLATLLTLLSALPLAAQSVTIPQLTDPRSRADRPDLTGLRTVRFLTDDEFPPLHFSGPDGLTGFSVELARAACERLKLTCTIQTRRFDTLLQALSDRGGDVVAAAVPITASLRERFGVTAPYFRFPARFAARREDPAVEIGPRMIENRTVAVVEETAHEAYLRSFFPKAALRPFPDAAAAAAALKRGDVHFLFGDGLTLALYVGGSEAAGCCHLVGGPYLESRYFGEGIGFVVRKEDEALRRALDHALGLLWDEGRYAELYLRFFPVSPF